MGKKNYHENDGNTCITCKHYLSVCLRLHSSKTKQPQQHLSWFNLVVEHAREILFYNIHVIKTIILRGSLTVGNGNFNKGEILIKVWNVNCLVFWSPLKLLGDFFFLLSSVNSGRRCRNASFSVAGEDSFNPCCSFFSENLAS